MKKYNKERKIKHLKVLASQHKTKEQIDIHFNLFDYIYGKQTENLRNSNGMVLGLYQFMKL